MDKLFTYTNADGGTVQLGAGNLHYSGADGAHDWQYSYTASNGAITDVQLKEREITFRLNMREGSLAERDALHDVLSYDVRHGTVGVLESNGWQLECFAVESSKVKWHYSDAAMDETVTFVTADPMWRRHTTVHLLPESGTEVVTTGLDYPHDYPFDYAGGAASSVDSVTVGAGGALARITFFGACSHPYVRIGSNVYGVDAAAEAGERIVVDPTKRRVVGGSVYKVGVYGERTNLYAYRRRGASGSGSYIFEQLPPGELPVSWPQAYGVDIDVIEERLEPQWS